jgi:hypothetical protein
MIALPRFMNLPAAHTSFRDLRLWFALIAGCLVLGGCYRQIEHIEAAHKRGLAENPIRGKIGLREIQPAWICFRSISGVDEWLSQPNDIAAVKTVERSESGSLVSEADIYLSGRKARVDDQTLDEALTLYYEYKSNEISLSYIGTDKTINSWIENAGNNQERLNVVKLVKAKWGIKE